MANENGAPVLALTGITKHFGAVRALRGVDFTVHQGEVTAIVGDNGAGKSTLIKVIAGAGSPTSGRIEFEGREVTIDRPQDATALGIATVYQDLALCDNLDVVANLFLGREETRRGVFSKAGWISEIDMESQAVELLATLSVNLPSVRLPVAALSGGQRQSVAIARAMLGDPKVVLLDEPTAALGVAQTAQVLDLILRLKHRGHAVVVISHNLADVFAVCDRVVVIRLGQVGGDFRVDEVSQEQVVAAITGARYDPGRPERGMRAGLPVVRPNVAGGREGLATS